MIQQASRLFLRTFYAALFTLLVACSESNDTTSKKAEGKVVPEKETTLEEKETVVNEEVVNEGINNDTKAIPNEATNELAEIEQQLEALKQKLTKDNQSNAALRQHMIFLMEKVKENQQILEKQADKIKPKAE